MPGKPDEFIAECEKEGVSASRNVDGFAIAAGDLVIFALVYEFRFLRREHISALSGRPAKRLHRRLFKLAHAGYLSVIRLPLQKHIYALGKKALAILVEQGRARPELLAERLRTHEIKELFLKHEMMIVDLHVMLALATQMEGSGLRLAHWREGRELFDSVSFADDAGLVKLPVRPDAFFTLEDLRRMDSVKKISFFLEADRSTAAQKRFQDKIRAYSHYKEQGLHAEKYGIKGFRVLTVTLTHERADNLCRLAAALVPERGRKSYLFTALQHFSLDKPSAILGAIYQSSRSAGSDAREHLVPPPQQPS